MPIKLVDDVGAPLGVVAIDLITESVRPDWNELVSYLVTVAGYGASQLRWGGDFWKNMGIAAMPWAAKNIYNRARGVASPVSGRLGVKRVKRYPAPPVEEPFAGRLV